MCTSAPHSTARTEGLLPSSGRELALTWPSRTCGKARKSNRQHQIQTNIKFNACIKWFEENYITSSIGSFLKKVHFSIKRNFPQAQMTKNQTKMKSKHKTFLFSWKTGSTQSFLSKSSPPSLLLNGKWKKKNLICLTLHIRWPHKTCLHRYKFTNKLSTFFS